MDENVELKIVYRCLSVQDVCLSIFHILYCTVHIDTYMHTHKHNIQSLSYLSLFSFLSALYHDKHEISCIYIILYLIEIT